MSKRISELPEYIGNHNPIGFVPISINGVTYKITPDLINYQPLTPLETTAARLLTEVKASEAITKGQAVYVSSANGTNIIVSKASSSTEATSSKTFGLMAQDLAVNGVGFVITEGLLAGLNTIGATVGDPVFLSTVAGNLIYGIANKPSAPQHLVTIGFVTRVNANNGEIFVKIQNGFELEELHNVSLVDPKTNNILGFDGSLWKNKSIPDWLGFTPVTNARTISTTAPLSGGGDMQVNRTLSISQANASTPGFISADDWNKFNNKLSAPTISLMNRDLLAYNSATQLWENKSFYDRALGGVQFFYDFDNSTPSYGLIPILAGTGASTARLTNFVPNQTANQIGICMYQTGTTATGWAMHLTESSANAMQFQFGGGSWIYESYIEVDTLSDITERFRFLSGFGNIASVQAETDGVFFIYDESGTSNGTNVSVNWQCISVENAVRTLTTTSVPVTNTWTKLRIAINASGTTASFYVNGTLVAFHTTNIPLFSNGRRCKVKQSIVKTAGTSNRIVYCDYIFYENTLTTLR